VAIWPLPAPHLGLGCSRRGKGAKGSKGAHVNGFLIPVSMSVRRYSRRRPTRDIGVAVVLAAQDQPAGMPVHTRDLWSRPAIQK
jgi:hypothetical protein